MRISDWSSDVCSSDLVAAIDDRCFDPEFGQQRVGEPAARTEHRARADQMIAGLEDRKSVVEGKSVSVRVDLGGRRIIKKKKKLSLREHILITIIRIKYKQDRHNII